MNLDFDNCYSAILSRDARFDGRFFAAVTTTGVYCRPVCPARKPHKENLRFYACAAAAEEDGFRPCLRCRPETAPGSAAWQGTSATVTRAIRLISEGFLDRHGVNALALKLGIGDRHLRRLFQQHLGVTPKKIAQTQRLHFAKQLLDESRLSITAVAFASGFSSIRRFNSAFKRAFGDPPSLSRKNSSFTVHHDNKAGLKVLIRYRPPFNWVSIIRFLRGRAIPGVEDTNENRYRRTACVDGITGIVEIRPDLRRHRLVVVIPRELLRGVAQIVANVKRLFDMDADPLSIEESLKPDPLLTAAVEKNTGLRVPGAWNGFEIAVRAILGQQVSVKGATTIAGRLVQVCGTPIRPHRDPHLTFLFPKPEQLEQADLFNIGIPEQRAKAIGALAKAVTNGAVDFDAGSDPDQIVQTLMALPGIGPWTAQYIAMRVLRQPDAFPSSDLGLLRAVSENMDGSPTESGLVQRAEAWRPWRAYAALYLWTSYVGKG